MHDAGSSERAEKGPSPQVPAVGNQGVREQGGRGLTGSGCGSDGEEGLGHFPECRGDSVEGGPASFPHPRGHERGERPCHKVKGSAKWTACFVDGRLGQL